MRLSDLARSAASALWRQKTRTLLTLSGVVVGATALVVSFSLGLGLRAMTEREFYQRPEFWLVAVYPGAKPVKEEAIPPDAIRVPAGVSPERADRVRRSLIQKYRWEHPSNERAELDRASLSWLARLPDVEDVFTTRTDQGKLGIGDQTISALIYAGRLDPFDPGSRLVAGRLPASADEILISEMTAFQLGLYTDAEVNGILGKEVQVSVGAKGQKGAFLFSALTRPGAVPGPWTRSQEELMDKLADKLPAALEKLDLTPAERAALAAYLHVKKPDPGTENRWNSYASATATVRVVGILRAPTEDEEKLTRQLTMAWQMPDVYLPTESGERLFGQLPWFKDRGYGAAVVKVRGGGNIEGVVAAVKAEGFQENSTVEWLKHARTEVTLIAAGLTIFALVALGVAAIGITNTMVTSVVERTREIGVLKAVGARDGQVMALFLAEGVALGALGGLLGYALARVLAGPLDRLCLRLVQQQTKQPLISTSVFEFPLWLGVGAVALVLVVTVSAAVYPAFRAARIQPVEAVRHE
ncbi:MAG TPA: ABC transporter permease [Fimbriiglobus sp.]|jgi:putative ABC transport system permease protein